MTRTFTSPSGRLAAAVILSCGALSACGSGSGTTPSGSSASGTPSGAAATTGATFAGTDLEGTSYRFRLPSSPSFVAGPREALANGAFKQRWQYAIRPNGPTCTVVAGEQPQYTQKFPESALAVFDAMNSEQGDHVVRNEAIAPIPGTVSGADSEATFVTKLDGGTRVPSRLFERQFLTSGKTLVSVAAAGPEEQVETCHLADVVTSLGVTGRELPASPSPSGS